MTASGDHTRRTRPDGDAETQCKQRTAQQTWNPAHHSPPCHHRTCAHPRTHSKRAHLPAPMPARAAGHMHPGQDPTSRNLGPPVGCRQACPTQPLPCDLSFWRAVTRPWLCSGCRKQPKGRTELAIQAKWPTTGRRSSVGTESTTRKDFLVNWA